MSERTNRPLTIVAVFAGSLAIGLALMMWLLDGPRGALAPAAIGGPFQMVDQSGATVTADKLQGKPTLLFFGYTHCPDICPATLANFAAALQKLGQRANDVRILFVTVDPDRDTGPILADYARAFAPEVEGLRGTDDQLTDVTRRYRVIYNVTPQSPEHSYEVMHSAAAFFFDRTGRARLVTTNTDDVAGLTSDLKQLLDM